jgi:hypothetical protein
MVFLLWAGAKTEAGHPLTEEEMKMFSEARQASIRLAEKIMRIKPHEYEYVHGQGFE